MPAERSRPCRWPPDVGQQRVRLEIRGEPLRVIIRGKDLGRLSKAAAAFPVDPRAATRDA